MQPTIRLVVMITGKFGNTDTFGAGIIFGGEKDRLYITTANHIVRKRTEAVQNLQIQLRGLPGTPLEATLLKSADPRRDLAVLSVERLSQDGIDVCAVPFDRLGESTAARRGAEVYPVGNPNGVPWSMPVVPDRIAQIVGDHFLFQSQFISKGHSGGGLLDERGRLIGMIQKDEPPFGGHPDRQGYASLSSFARLCPDVIAAVQGYISTWCARFCQDGWHPTQWGGCRDGVNETILEVFVTDTRQQALRACQRDVH